MLFNPSGGFYINQSGSVLVIFKHTHPHLLFLIESSLSNWTQCRPKDQIISLILSEMLLLLSFSIPLIGATGGRKKVNKKRLTGCAVE